MKKYLADRRSFLEFLGLSSVALSQLALTKNIFVRSSRIEPLLAHREDTLKTVKGIQSEVLIQWDDPISKKQNFGISNDFIAFFSDKKLNNGRETDGYLWVNHEFPMPFLQDSKKNSKKENVIRQQKSVGGTILRVRKKEKKPTWGYIKNSSYNKRLDGRSKIPFTGSAKVQGQDHAIGTFANCCGGQTAWGTFLSCEENYDHYYGEVKLKNKKRFLKTEANFGWEKYYNYPPEHYGWVVEINPLTAEAKKLVALGRFAHEGATHVVAKDGRSVVYMADDKAKQFIYKFISSRPGSLEEGELFVADLKKGKWLSLDWHKNPILQQNFKDPLECLIHTRSAAKLLGATPCARPEGIAINPIDQSINVCLTGDEDPENFFGSILKIYEKNQDHLSLDLSHQTYITGGQKQNFANPDNIQFDSAGNLWFTTDVSDKKVDTDLYKEFGNNSLYVVPSSGPQAGEVIRVVSGPIGSELTGICFDEKEDCLFLSVQHPGSNSTSKKELTSHWPNGGDSIPRSAVVMLSGPLFKSLNNNI